MKVGFFAGGGVTSAFTAGALQGIPSLSFEYLYGYSGGAINALAYSYLGREGLCNLWMKCDPLHRLYRPQIENYWWVFSHQPLKEIVRRIIDHGEKRVPFSVAYKYRTTGEVFYTQRSPRYLTDYEATVASCCIPGVIAEYYGYVDPMFNNCLPMIYHALNHHNVHEILVFENYPQSCEYFSLLKTIAQVHKISVTVYCPIAILGYSLWFSKSNISKCFNGGLSCMPLVYSS